MLKPKTRWIVRKHLSDETVRTLSNELDISPLLAELLVNRGITEVESARCFLFDKGESFHDPFLLKDMDKAVRRIKEAIKNEENILVYGDYDADGVTSTSVMVTALQDLGANVDYYIPNRFTEGYGPNENAFRLAKSRDIHLIITVDTGIAAVKEVALAKELGMDVIITDHHEPGPVIPEAFAVIHPKHPEGNYPFPYLAGVGVAFKTAHALYGELPENLLDLAAIGTVADLVPLLGENRSLVKAGLKKLQQTSRLGIQAICRLNGVSLEEINEDTIGYMIAPRLNAAGRLDSAYPAVDLLLAEDQETALSIAEEINRMNADRQQMVNEMTKEAVEIVETSYPPDRNPVLVIGKEGWNPGVIGIAASRLVEKYYRPVIILSFDRESGLAKGSARSIQGFNLFDSLSECRDLLPHFGGHTMAAGMTMKIEDVDRLRSRMIELAREQLNEEDFIPQTEVDMAINLEDAELSMIEELQLLAPFGTENPKPTFLLGDLAFRNMRKIGADQSHLKMQLASGDASLDAIGFGMGEMADHIAPQSKVSVIGELGINEWNHIKKPQIVLQDIQVKEWQLFDVRGMRQLDKWMDLVPDDRILIVFHEDTIARLRLQPLEKDLVVVSNLETAANLDISGRNIVFMDLPPKKEYMEILLSHKSPNRIYAHFYQEKQHYFSTVPTREHFKWYYAFLLKQKTFDLKRYSGDLAKYRGWSKETIEFMSRVFLELGFVTIEDGLISLNEAPAKRDLSESKAYREKQEQYQIENELLYSNYEQLRDWFNQYFYLSQNHEEETKTWI
ncbi:single-stranded-DNA-specific exonuclease RecJ [Bacillus sp. FSL W8-0116]|uniref:single-stranded-DNA-specific exonuclease RecJ n=1 Tax=Bacillus sp. FSL W8-0116 TaxID=2978206 RepID=UPI0030FB64AC